MLEHAYKLTLPRLPSSCAVFSSAHSGSSFPPGFAARSPLTMTALRSSEDAFVDRLIASAPESGAPLLSAHFSRAYVDLNRAESELDPALIHGLARQKTNPRLTVGLGVLPRVVSGGRAIMHGKITLAEANERLRHYYHPYHATLDHLITEQQKRHGISILFDFHSMPKDAISAGPHSKAPAPDIVLGDRFGAACDRWIIDATEDLFNAAGFKVARNTPFAGGYITQTYGQPRKAKHAVQIEINRALYMDEQQIRPLPSFDDFQIQMSQIVHCLALLGPVALKVAAE